ncbi:MAG TPA: polysaccharide deacetylase family protein [Sporichthyaceae bacterium]|nr:polysaccharide deacetylase family protein [Sporichthyaceae bacterium]
MSARRTVPVALTLLLLAACGGPNSAVAAAPPSVTPRAETAGTATTTASPTPVAYVAPAGTGRAARVVITAPVYDAPGARVPVIVTVHNPPPDLPADAMSATTTQGQITDCGAAWHNPRLDQTSRTCYLLAPTAVTRLDLAGEADWQTAWGSQVTLHSAPLPFRTEGPVSGPVSLPDAQRIENCDNPGPSVWLTFDDVVRSVAVAKQMVATLARNHARGRFFLNHVTPAIRAVIEDGGHTINDHTRDHLAMNTMSNAQIAEQISGGPRTTAGAPKVLRPPYGAGAEASRIVERIAAAGYATCRWSVDTRDWAGYTPAQMADAVRYGNSFTPPVHAGGVILMHATHFSPAKLQAVIDAVHARGLQVA